MYETESIRGLEQFQRAGQSRQARRYRGVADECVDLHHLLLLVPLPLALLAVAVISAKCETNVT